MADMKIIDINSDGDVNPDQGFSRRSFIKGVISTGAVVSSSNYMFRGSGQLSAQSSAGSVGRLLTLNVNGQSRRVDVSKQETLAMTLRYKLGLTGTKIGCDRAECGSCTVLVDGVPHYGCSVLTHNVRDRQVTTVEGLESTDGTLHPVQQAIVDEQGFQCAFCMSGFSCTNVHSASLDEKKDDVQEDEANQDESVKKQNERPIDASSGGIQFYPTEWSNPNSCPGEVEADLD